MPDNKQINEFNIDFPEISEIESEWENNTYLQNKLKQQLNNIDQDKLNSFFDDTTKAKRPHKVSRRELRRDAKRIEREKVYKNNLILIDADLCYIDDNWNNEFSELAFLEINTNIRKTDRDIYWFSDSGIISEVDAESEDSEQINKWERLINFVDNYLKHRKCKVIIFTDKHILQGGPQKELLNIIDRMDLTIWLWSATNKEFSALNGQANYYRYKELDRFLTDEDLGRAIKQKEKDLDIIGQNIGENKLPKYELDFFEAWDELNEAVSYSEIPGIINGTSSAATKQDLKDACIELSKLYPHWRTHPEIWPYQLQLMYNAYIIETGCLTELNKTDGIRDEINRLLTNTGLKIYDNTQFKFNDDIDHEQLGATRQHRTKAKPDLVNASTNRAPDEVDTIEIKATKGYAGNADRFHDAQLVLIYTINDNNLYLRIKNADGIYTKPVRLTTFSSKFPCITIYTDDDHIPAADELKYSNDPNFKKSEAKEQELENQMENQI